MQSVSPAKIPRTDIGGDGNHAFSALQSEPSTSATGTNAQSRPLTDEAITGKLGGEGEEYQRLRAYMMVLEGVLGMDLWLQFEMIDAKKFEDICVFYKENWNLIQTKHSEPICSENEKKLTYGTLFGRDKSNPFMLLKYLFDFDEIKKKEEWIHGKINKIIICTNCELNVNSYEGNWLREISNEMHELLKLSKGKHYQLIGQEGKMMELLLEDAFERDYNQIFEAIVKLFENKKMSPILERYHTFLKKILINDGQKVMFSKEEPTNIPVVKKIYKQLQVCFKKKIKQQKECEKQFELGVDVMGNFWTQTEDFVQRVDFETVKEFLSKLVLSVEQPNVTELRQDIVDKGINWMRTWIRPDVLGRMSQSILELPLTIIKKKFDAYEKPSLKETSDGKKKNVKAHLRAIDFEAILKDIKKQINDEAEKLTQRSFPPFYITRQLSNTNNVFSESEFIESLFTEKSENEKKNCHLFSAQPGMGKTTLMQNLAFEAQKTHSDKAVFLIYLNHFRHEVPEIQTLPDILKKNVFKSELSAENVKLLVENSESQIVIFFDAFDELNEENKKRILKVIDVLRRKSNIRIVISGRNNVREMLEKHLKVPSIELTPFSKEDQIEYFENFWNNGKNDKNEFKEFAHKILAKLNTDLSNHAQSFIGVPLMTWMVAEIFYKPDDAADKFITADTFNIVNLFDKFVERSITVMLNKKYGADKNDEPDSVFNKCLIILKITEDIDYFYQVFALQDRLSYKDSVFPFLTNRKFHETLQNFERDFQTYQSLVLECHANGPNFTHLLFRDYFVAKIMFDTCDKFEKHFYDDNLRRMCDESIYFLVAMANRSGRKSVMKCISFLGTNNSIPILVQSCLGDFLNVIKYLCETQSPSIFSNCRYIEGSHERRDPCLQITAKYDSKQVDQYLVELFKQKIYCKYPLHTFVESNRLDLVEQFLNEADNTSHINLEDVHGDTPLFLAKSVDMFKLLIVNGAELDGFNLKKQNIIYRMFENVTCDEMDQILLFSQDMDYRISHYFSDKDAKSIFCNIFESLYCNKKTKDNVKKVKILIDKLANKNIAFDAAVKKGDLEIVRYMIEKYKVERTQKFYEHGMAHYLHYDIDPGSLFPSIETCIQFGLEDKADRFRDTALHRVFRKDCVEAAKLFKREGVDLNVQYNRQGNTLLHKAIKKGYYKVAEWLAEQDIDLSKADDKGNTVLHTAARKKNITVGKILIKKYSESCRSLDDLNNEGKTALMIADENGDDSFVQLFLDSGAKLDFYEKLTDKFLPILYYLHEQFEKHLPEDKISKLSDVRQNNALLHMAVQLGFVKVSKLLIDTAADIRDSKGQTPLHLACNKAMFELLVSSGADVDMKGDNNNSPLHIAVSNGNEKMIEYLINSKNTLGKTALHLAFENGLENIIKLLIKHEADINCEDNDGKSPLYYGLQSSEDHFEPFLIQTIKNSDVHECDKLLFQYLRFEKIKASICEALLGKIADKNTRGEHESTFLHVAVQENKFDAVKILIKNGADVNAKDDSGNIPLHYAFKKNFTYSIVGYLADFSSKTYLKNCDGKTPLHLGIESRNESSAKVLIYKRASINLTDKQLNTYLHLAIRYNKMDVAQILIDRFDPSDLNKQNIEGETALHVAVLKDKFDIVKKLVEKGIELLPIKTKEGKTASVLARDNSKTEIYDFLKRREESEYGVEH